MCNNNITNNFFISIKNNTNLNNLNYYCCVELVVVLIGVFQAKDNVVSTLGFVDRDSK